MSGCFLDNILSLAPQTAKGNTTKFQKFIQSLKNNNISTIIIHHSTKGGESPKGPVELEALMQNIFRLERGEDLPELRSVEAVRTALGEAGPTMKMTLTKCKVFPSLEKKSLGSTICPKVGAGNLWQESRFLR